MRSCRVLYRSVRMALSEAEVYFPGREQMRLNAKAPV